MSEKIHVRARKFLEKFFNDEELRTFCFDNFSEVYKNFSDGMTRNDKVLMLVAYCQRRDKFKELLVALERERPKQYHTYFVRRFSLQVVVEKVTVPILFLGGIVFLFLVLILWPDDNFNPPVEPTRIAEVEIIKPEEIRITDAPESEPTVTETPTPTQTFTPTITSTIELSPTETLTPSSTPTNSPAETPPIRSEITIRDWLRSGPDTGYSHVGDAPLEIGMMVVIVAKTLGGDWLLVSLEDGRNGWIVKSMVEIPIEEIIPTAVTRPPTLTPTKTPTVFPTLPVEPSSIPTENGPTSIPPTNTPKPTTAPPSG